MKKFLALLLTLCLTLCNVLVLAEETPTNNDLVLIEGTVSLDAETIDGPAFLLTDSDNKVYQVSCTEDQLAQRFDGEWVAIAYDGITTRSIPAQLTAMEILSTAITGTITAIDSDTQWVLTLESGEEVILHLSEETINQVTPEIGLLVRVVTTGTATLSLPAQYSALTILPAAPVTPSITGTVVLDAETIDGPAFLLTGIDGKTYHVCCTEKQLTLLTEGDLVTITYNGQLTRSLPAQLTAIDLTVIQPVTLTGLVSLDAETIDGPAFLLKDEDGKTYHVCCTEAQLSQVFEGEKVTVTYDGTTTRSLPAQLTALFIQGDTLTGTIASIDSDSQWTLTLESGEQLPLHITEDTICQVEPAVGQQVTIVRKGGFGLYLTAQVQVLAVLAAE